jgi:hypothetical protein
MARRHRATRECLLHAIQEGCIDEFFAALFKPMIFFDAIRREISQMSEFTWKRGRPELTAGTAYRGVHET